MWQGGAQSRRRCGREGPVGFARKASEEAQGLTPRGYPGDSSMALDVTLGASGSALSYPVFSTVAIGPGGAPLSLSLLSFALLLRLSFALEAAAARRRRVHSDDHIHDAPRPWEPVTLPLPKPAPHTQARKRKRPTSLAPLCSAERVWFCMLVCVCVCAFVPVGAKVRQHLAPCRRDSRGRRLRGHEARGGGGLLRPRDVYR